MLNQKTLTSPYKRSWLGRNWYFADVIIALIPSLICGIYNFGAYCVPVTVVCAAVCFGCDALFGFIRSGAFKADLSAVVTGMLIALNLPPTAPLWTAALGAVFATAVLKQPFGGTGKNLINPAMGARALLLLLFYRQMTLFTIPPGTSSKTLAYITNGTLPDMYDMLWGRMQGCIGTTSAGAIIIGFVYLLIRKTIDARITFTYILSFSALVFFLSNNPFSLSYIFCDLMAGGLLMAAMININDPVTTPTTLRGRYIFGFFGGAAAFAVMKFIGVEYAGALSVVVMNLTVPLIERFIIPDSLGTKKGS